MFLKVPDSHHFGGIFVVVSHGLEERKPVLSHRPFCKEKTSDLGMKCTLDCHENQHCCHRPSTHSSLVLRNRKTVIEMDYKPAEAPGDPSRRHGVFANVHIPHPYCLR